MASITTNLHVRDNDEIRADAYEGSRWIRIGKAGETGLAIFASDEQMRALRDAINAHLREQPAQDATSVLAAALRPFADLGVGSGPDEEHDSAPYRITRGAIRSARAALAEVEA